MVRASRTDREIIRACYARKYPNDDDDARRLYRCAPANHDGSLGNPIAVRDKIDGIRKRMIIRISRVAEYFMLR